MPSFLKSFLASMLALVVFSLLLFFMLLALIPSSPKPAIQDNAVLMLDLSQHFREQEQPNPLGVFASGEDDVPGLYDVVRLIQRAAADKRIAGIYLEANNNSNGFAASDEIRKALAGFREKGKFIIAHGDVMSQRAYSIANCADRVYLSPQGYLDWSGYSVEYMFFKGTLDKLEIEPQIFYAGKFKSATEPFRTDKMTPENALQTSVWLNDLYERLLQETAEARKLDTATLHQLANAMQIRSAADAVSHQLIDSLKYDDQVRDEIKQRLKLGKYDRINFLSLATYKAATAASSGAGGKIALIYAEGDIIDGKGQRDQIGSETFRNLLRKARLDQSVKAIVFRVNSGGGSSLASENIWRELELAKKEKPVVVSFGDVAASGGYYISCAADSIFASPATITGSIGVFGIIPNMEGFFKNKLGITFDGVRTADHAGAGSVYKPMKPEEKAMVQAEIETIYTQFKMRVAEGRKKDTAYIDSIAQGRVWTGQRAIGIGLVDRFGTLDDAVHCAARMAGLTSYHVSEYPEPLKWLEQLLGKKDPLNYLDKIKSEMSEEDYRIYMEWKRVRDLTSQPQARLPFQFFVR